MARWRRRPLPVIPEWVWALPAGHPDLGDWLRAAPVAAGLEYLQVTLSAPVGGDGA